MTKLFVLLAALSMTGEAQQNPDQFDLQCTGTARESGTQSTKPWSHSYRIDLEEQSFCEGDCSQVQPLNAGPNELELGEFTSVNRSTGHLSSVESDIMTADMMAQRKLPPAYVVDAACTSKPFSGFPRKF